MHVKEKVYFCKTCKSDCNVKTDLIVRIYLYPSHYDVYSSFSHAFICSESDYSSNTMPPVHPGIWNQIKFSCGSGYPHHLLRRDSQFKALLLNRLQLTILPLLSYIGCRF